MRRALLALVVVPGIGVGLGACGGDAASPPPAPRPVVVPADALVFAEWTTLHVGDTAYDLGRRRVQELDRTPYGVFVRAGHRTFFFDGETRTPIDEVDREVITSPDGELAAWIDRTGPERPAGQVAQVVVVRTRTGETVFSTAEGMGGEEGDDLADRYEELPPRVVDLTDERLVWVDAAGSGSYVVTDLATGESTLRDREPRLLPTSGWRFRSPDGEYRVTARSTYRVRVHPEQPDFGHRWVRQGGWLGPHTMLALGQDTRALRYNPRRPDTTPGVVLSCDLATGECEQLAEVGGARDVVFPGVDQIV